MGSTLQSVEWLLERHKNTLFVMVFAALMLVAYDYHTKTGFFEPNPPGLENNYKYMGGGVWTDQKVGDFTCDGTLIDGRCVQPNQVAARATCDADVKCIGYVNPLGEWAMKKTYEDAVLLVSKKPVANSKLNGTFFEKPK